MKLYRLGFPLIILSLTLGSAHAQISTNGLRLWLRADAGVTTNGTTVSQWADQSGNGHEAFQATVGFQPTYLTNGLNGKPVLQFDGSGDHLTGTVTSISSPLTLIVVGYFGVINPASGDYDYMIQMGDGNNQNISIARTTAAPADAPYTNTFYSLTHNTALFGPRIPGQTWNVFSQVWSNSAPRHSLFLNGKPQSVVDTGSGVTLNGNYMIGGTISGGYYLNGRVAEIILYEGALSQDARFQIENYLGDKYAITVPEPGAAVLLGFGAFAGLRRRR